MHKIRALCLLIRTETLQNATAGRGVEGCNRRECERLYFLWSSIFFGIDLYQVDNP